MRDYDIALSALGILTSLWSIGFSTWLVLRDRQELRFSMRRLLVGFAALAADVGQRPREHEPNRNP
jgi:hypothetical protein